MKIANESYKIITTIIIFLSISIFLHLYISTSILTLCLAFTIYFFRDPEREINWDPKTLYAPADGKILEIKSIVWNNTPYTQIVIFMNVFNVHINRIPYTGKIVTVNYTPGKFLNASNKGIETQNERMEIVSETIHGRIKFVQIAGLIARKIVCYLKPNDETNVGQRFGLIKFGSRVDVYIPASAKILININQKTTAGITKIAEFTSNS